MALAAMLLARLENVTSRSSLVLSLFRLSGGAIVLPLLLGLSFIAEVWRRKARAPAWPQVLPPILLVPSVLLSALGAKWAGIDRGLGYPTWRAAVFFGLGLSELVLSFACVRAGRRRWPVMLSIVAVALLWTLSSWIGAALSVGADTL